jgi:multiple sugar transport system substrate-binding protein
MYRRLLIVGLAVALVTGLGGLSQGQATVSITLVGFSGDTPVVQDLLNHLKGIGKLPANVNVVWEPEAQDMRQRVLNDLAAGGAALRDIYYIDVFWAPEVVGTGKLQSLNGFISQSAELGPDLRAKWLEPLVDAFEFDGQVYAVAKDFNSLVIWYNKDVFRQAGVDFPSNEDDWFDFLRKAQAVNKVVPEGTAAINLNPDPVRFLPFAFANGMPFMLGLCAPFATEEAITAAEFFTLPNRFGFGRTSSDVGAGWPGAAFTAEKGFIVNEGGWMLGPIQNENPTLDFGVAFLPLTPNGKRANYLFTVGYGIPADLPSDRKGLAFQVVEALVSKEANLFVLEKLAIPPRKELLEDPNSPLANPQTPFQEAARVVFEATAQPGTRPFTFGAVGGPAYLDTLGEALTKIMVDGVPVREAMEEAAVKLNQRLVDEGLVPSGVCPGT